MTGDRPDAPRTPVAANGFDPFAAQRADPTQPMADPYAMLFASLAERYPDTFGGMYFEGNAAVVVQVLENSEAAVVVREAADHLQAYSPVGAAPTVRAETVRNTYATLNDAAHSVQADQATITAQGANLFAVSLDQQRNRVLAVFMGTTAELREQIISTYGGPDVIVAATTTGGRRKL
jgi:hypothetical protein